MVSRWTVSAKLPPHPPGGRFVHRSRTVPALMSTGLHASAFQCLLQHVQRMIELGVLGTVVWSRPPNSSPISGRLFCVNSLARYIATWRGAAMLVGRRLLYMSEILIL